MVRNLGQKKAYYSNQNRPISNYFRDMLGFLSCFFAFMMLVFMAGFFSNGDPIVLIFAIVFLVGLLITIYVIRSNQNNYVELYDFGFVFGKQGQTKTVYFDEIKSTRWSSIERTRVGPISIESYSLKIEKIDGEILKLTNANIYMVLDLGFKIQQHFSALKIPGLLASLQNGEEVQIGNFVLSTEGVQYKKKFASWSEVEFAKIERGMIWIVKRYPNYSGIWRGMSLSEPNAMFLHDLVNTYKSGNQSTH